MGLKTVVDSEQLGELDESIQGLYTETEDGSYALDVEDVDNHPTVQALKNGHKNSKKERDEFKAKAKDYERRFGPLAQVAEDLDLSDADEDTLSKVAKYLKGEGDLGGEGKGPDVDIDKVKEAAKKPLQRDLESVTQERDQIKAKFEQVVADNALTSAVSEAKVHGPYVKAVKAMFRNNVHVSEDEDGNPVAMIEGEYGEQPVEKYIKEWAQTDEGKAFIEAPANGGGGASGGSKSGKIKNPWSQEHWNVTEQGRIYREDPERAKKMASEYGKRVA